MATSPEDPMLLLVIKLIILDLILSPFPSIGVTCPKYLLNFSYSIVYLATTEMLKKKANLLKLQAQISN